MFFAASPRLDATSLVLPDEHVRVVVEAIAEETERQRDIEREKYSLSLIASGQPPTLLLLGGEYNYADTLRWDVLLTFGDCLQRCAQRTGASEMKVLDVALQHCAQADPWMLFWFQNAIGAMSQGMGSEVNSSKAIEALAAIQAKHQRIKEGARIGGQKSGATRRKAQSTPPGRDLKAERQALIDGGLEARNVTSFLARKYNVTPAAIRAAYERK